MKRVVPIQNRKQLNACHREGIEEVILTPRLLSRFGRHQWEECLELARESRQLGLRPLLEWDILMPETLLASIISTLSPAPPWQHFDGIRVQDKGALNYLLNHPQSPPLQLILETGHHNLEGIQSILEATGDQVERVVLSPELPRERVLQAARELPVAVEILGLGKILLYYGPRHLLGAQGTAHAHSLEGPHKNLPVLENDHGTFLFHSRERFIVHLAKELAVEGLGALRIESPEGAALSLIARSTSGEYCPQAVKELRQHWPAALTQGFFQHNKTDGIFKKLKNTALPSRDHHYIGEVLEVVKGHHTAVFVKSPHNPLIKGGNLTFHTPEGRIRHATVLSLRDTSLREREQIGQGEIALLPPLAGLSTKTFVLSTT